MKGILPLRVNGAWMAIDAAQVVEILGARPRAQLPDASPLAPAVVAFRGRAVAALDLGLLTGAAPALAGGEVRARTVIVRAGASTLALPVDAAREVLELEDADVGPPPAALGRSASHAVTFAGASVPVLDLDHAAAELAEGGR